MAPANSLHPTNDTLVAVGLGKIDDAGWEAVRRHLEECAECRGRVAEVSGDSFIARLRAARPDETGEPARSLSGLSRSLGRTTNGVPPELTSLPQYDEVRELGQGGMGVVYLARNKLMDRLEVLKVLNRALLTRPGAAERFLQEVRAAARLQHPNVVAAYAAMELGELLVFAMEYLPGDDLAKLVQARGALPVTNACWYAYQAALGLQHAHEKGMVHRDIKPSNLMLTHQGKKQTVKILDFGLAKATREGEKGSRELTGHGMMMGTPDYVAPEQSLDATKADIRADIYSLGCTLYCLLAGRPPFEAEGIYQLLAAHHDSEATPLHQVRGEVPQALSAVVARMMAKEPAERFQTPGEAARALAPFCKASPKAANASTAETKSRGATTPPRPRPQSGARKPTGNGRGRLVVAAAMALPLLLAGIVIVVKWTKKDGSSTEVKVTVGEDAPRRIAPPPAVRAAGKVAVYPHGTGRWQIEGDELVQANPDADATGLYFGVDAWEDYDFTVKFKRLKGAPRLAIRFRCQDAMNDCTFGLHMDRQVAWLSQHFARKPQQLGLDTPTEVGDGWHKLTAKLRGQKVECLINDRIIYQMDSIVYRRGYVGIALNTETSVRFKDLQVTDKDGRVLVGGVTDLDLADRPGSPAAKFDDEAKAGTVWKGKCIQYINDNPVYRADDFEMRILTRDGMNFTAEFWIEGKTRGAKIEGRIDAKGNVSYLPVSFLGVGRPIVADDQLGKWQLATFKGKEFRAVVLNTKNRNNRCDTAATRVD